jgi:hypothetical protein
LHSRSFAHVPRVAEAFIAAGRAGHYQCDLTALARMSLIAAGVEQVYGGKHCSYGDQQRFYSYRRQPVCGRMATLIVLRER